MHDLLILIPNYNNCEYLKQCLDSILNQKTNFNFFIIINDDKSTDKSIEIIEEYILNYPNKIKLIKMERNDGTLSTTLELYLNINTKYFTVLDSDDYWLDNKFIDRALTFLEKNSDYYIYSENTKVLNINTNNFTNLYPLTISNNGFDKEKNIYRFSCPHTSSTIFRGNFDSIILDKVKQIVINKNINDNIINKILEQTYEGDLFRNIYFSIKGKIFENYMNFAGCYRIKNSFSRWSSLNEDFKIILNSFGFIELIKLTDNIIIQEHLFNTFMHFFNQLINLKLHYDNDYIYNNKKLEKYELYDIFNIILKKIIDIQKKI